MTSPEQVSRPATTEIARVARDDEALRKCHSEAKRGIPVLPPLRSFAFAQDDTRTNAAALRSVAASTASLPSSSSTASIDGVCVRPVTATRKRHRELGHLDALLRQYLLDRGADLRTLPLRALAHGP